LYDLIFGIWSSNSKGVRRGDSSSAHIAERSRSVSLVDDDPMNSGSTTLTNVDWELIIKGARTITYTKDDVIIEEGQKYQRIYQINKGICRIEKIKNGKNVVLGHMGVEESFGEISFLQGSGTTASVIADQDGVELCIIEGYFMKMLFGLQRGLASRFFKYLAAGIASRVRQREQDLYKGRRKRKVSKK